MQPHDDVSKADLHIHSKHSNRPSEWFLRKIGAPESFVEPRALYDNCRQRGMDFVTISDHNTINGALEIADLPYTFISCEVTTYFPEDGGRKGTGPGKWIALLFETSDQTHRQGIEATSVKRHRASDCRGI